MGSTTYTHPVSSIGDTLIGRRLDGRYRVVRRLAGGGMATVYLAIDERLARDVALKVMRPHLAHDESFVTRFRREARSAAALSHPHVVAVYDQGEDDGHVFLTMEYVPGKTLREVLLDDGPLSPRAALDLLEALLEALAEAHRKGLIHRDVKPENVILGAGGMVKVADFGLARAVSSQTVTSSSGMLLGTVAYLAPEQVERGVADPRSDVYAAGLVLFEMLTGSKAFTGETPIHVAYQHVHGGVPLPSSRMPGLPTELDDLVSGSTSRDPDERPADAGAFLQVVRATRARLSVAALDAHPDGTTVPTATATATAPVTTAASPGSDGSGASRGTGSATRRDFAADDLVTTTARTTALRLPGRPRDEVPVARRRRWWPAVIGAVLVATLAAWFFIVGPAASVRIPTVAGLTQDDAAAALRLADLEAMTTRGFSEDIPPGQVVSSDPRSGTSIRRGSEVVLVISAGPERYTVPDIVGATLNEARNRLIQDNLELGATSGKYDDRIPEGQVLAAAPAVGTEVKKGTVVALVLSRGRQPVDLLDWTGKNATAATTALTKAGLTVDATRLVNDDTVPAGRVVSQSPRDGTVFKGDTITLVVSKGPVLVDVPNVVGRQGREARRILESAGFTVRIEKALGGYFGTVRFQDPARGSRAPRGSLVTLTIV
jgi:eukaryotic-like serine/threonine-protein kinase